MRDKVGDELLIFGALQGTVSGKLIGDVDLSADPGENQDLLASGGAGAIATRARLLAAGPSSLVAATSPDPMLEAKGKLRESLRALGYVED